MVRGDWKSLKIQWSRVSGSCAPSLSQASPRVALVLFCTSASGFLRLSSVLFDLLFGIVISSDEGARPFVAVSSATRHYNLFKQFQKQSESKLASTKEPIRNSEQF